MHRLVAPALALVALSLWGCAERDPTDPSTFELRWESEQLVLLAHEGAATTDEAETVMTYGEAVYGPIATFLGSARVPHRKVELAGEHGGPKRHRQARDRAVQRCSG